MNGRSVWLLFTVNVYLISASFLLDLCQITSFEKLFSSLDTRTFNSYNRNYPADVVATAGNIQPTVVLSEAALMWFTGTRFACYVMIAEVLDLRIIERTVL